MKLTRKSVFSLLATFALCTFMIAAPSCGGDEPDSGNGNGQGKEEPTPEPDTNPTDELKIMSFNVRYPATADVGENAWDARKAACAAMINDIKPDVVATQETRTNQRTDLKAMLPDYAFVEIMNTGTSAGANIVMLYRKNRFTLIKSDKFFLSYTPDYSSKCFDVADNQRRASITVYLKDNLTGKEIAVCGTHFPVGGDTALEKEKYAEARVLSAQLCIDRLKKFAGDDMMSFLLGDFNVAWKDVNGNPNPNGVEVKSVLETWMKDSRDYAKNDTPGLGTFQSFGSAASTPNRIIDHIFYRNAETIDFQTITKPYDGIRYISDHYPIMLRVKF